MIQPRRSCAVSIEYGVYTEYIRVPSKIIFYLLPDCYESKRLLPKCRNQEVPPSCVFVALCCMEAVSAGVM